MHFSALAPVALLAATVAAQDVSEEFTIHMRTPEDEFLDGRELTAGIAGDNDEYAILCSVDNVSSFRTVTRSGAEDPVEGFEPVDLVTVIYDDDSNGLNSTMRFDVEPSSNLAFLVFERQEPSARSRLRLVMERETGEFALVSVLDDTTNPAEPRGEPKLYRNWYHCGPNQLGPNMMYPTIRWMMGNGDEEAVNPGCTKITLEKWQ